MTTLLQVQANRRNALKSTGPRSSHGKAMSRRNSVRHGVISWKPVLLPGESSAAWEKFARLVVVDLDPIGPVEAMWAGRIALLLWRLQRSMDARKTLADQQWRDAEALAHKSPAWEHRRNVDKHFPSSMQGVRDALKKSTAQRALLRQILALPPGQGPGADCQVNGAAAAGLIDWAAEHLRLDDELTNLNRQNLYPGLGQIWPEDDLTEYHWTAGMVREGLTWLAQLTHETLDQLTATLSPALDESHRLIRANLRRAEREIRRYRRCVAANSMGSLAKFERYDTFLERSLARAQSQLRRLQSERRSALPPDHESPSRNVVKMGFVQLESPEKPA